MASQAWWCSDVHDVRERVRGPQETEEGQLAGRGVPCHAGMSKIKKFFVQEEEEDLKKIHSTHPV